MRLNRPDDIPSQILETFPLQQPQSETQRPSSLCQRPPEPQQYPGQQERYEIIENGEKIENNLKRQGTITTKRL